MVVVAPSAAAPRRLLPAPARGRAMCAHLGQDTVPTSARCLYPLGPGLRQQGHDWRLARRALDSDQSGLLQLPQRQRLRLAAYAVARDCLIGHRDRVGPRPARLLHQPDPNERPASVCGRSRLGSPAKRQQSKWFGPFPREAVLPEFPDANLAPVPNVHHAAARCLMTSKIVITLAHISAPRSSI
jgi:hypothetical protein